jgi:hypothetical protein
MFRLNEEHRQQSLFSFVDRLPESVRKRLLASEEALFYEQVFCRINERQFAHLYAASEASRPNAPVNVMVGALLLMQLKDWTFEELFDELSFNLATRYALGMADFEVPVMCPATLFNFQRKVRSWDEAHGTNTWEGLLEELTAHFVEALGVSAWVQRADSTLVGSNIRRYGRVDLLVTVLRRMHEELSEEDRERWKERFAPWLKEEFCRGIRPSKVEETLADLGEHYHWMVDTLEAGYGDTESYGLVERVFREHFHRWEDVTAVRDEPASDTLQSPDDPEATYRKKGDQISRGYVLHVSETAVPEQPVQLITDVSVEPNTTDDAKLLGERLPGLADRYPELEEYHTDAAYGSPANDAVMEERGILHVQTAVKGAKAKNPSMHVEEVGPSSYQVTCGAGRTEEALLEGKSFRATFPGALCDRCPLRKKCPARRLNSGDRSYRFTHADYLRWKRHRALESLPPERQKLRPNVEATIREFKHPMRRGKLRVKGLQAARRVLYLKAVMINFRRLRKYMRTHGERPDSGPFFGPNLPCSGQLRLLAFIFAAICCFIRRNPGITVKVLR